MNEEKLNKEFEVYREMAKQDKQIDVASLMMNALQKQQSNMLSDKEKRWGYLISLSLPPFGLIFAARFFVSSKDDAKQAAWFCVALTAVSILLFIALGKILLSGSGTSVDQIQEIRPQDIEELLQ